jgi:hypothetical protein
MMASRDGLPLIATRRRPSGNTLAGHGDAYLNRLNDIHVNAQLTVRALEDLLLIKKKSKSTYSYFRVPTSGGGSGGIRRRMSSVSQLLHGLIVEGEYSKSLLFMVSVTEDYIQSVMRIVLTAHPEHLALGLNGGKSDIALPLLEVLETGIETLVRRLVDDRLKQILYASPDDYFNYLKVSLGIRFDSAIVSAFIEAKATRDIVVHANGVANGTYLRKAGALNRAAVGEPLPIDQHYFDRCLTIMKDLIEDVRAKMIAKYGDDPSVQRTLANALASLAGPHHH